MAANSRDKDGKSDIYVWQKGPKKHAKREGRAEGCHIWTRIKFAAQIITLLATVAFIFQNLNATRNIFKNAQTTVAVAPSTPTGFEKWLYDQEIYDGEELGSEENFDWSALEADSL